MPDTLYIITNLEMPWAMIGVRYCMVLFAGIAAEALVYGEAEGGENDENLFRSICILLQPPLSVAQVHILMRLS